MLQKIKNWFNRTKITEATKKPAFSLPEKYYLNEEFPSIASEILLSDYGECEDVQLLLTYPVKAIEVATRPGCWNAMDVYIYKVNLDDFSLNSNSINMNCGKREGKKIGAYQRNYYNFYQTWYPFRQGDKHFALFSRDYQTVEVMSLPDCNIIAKGPVGFCPTYFYVPFEEECIRGHYYMPQTDGSIGFVAGCYWGDDCGGWKLQVLDLSKVQEGVLRVSDEKIGYTELAGFNRLHEVVDVRWNYYFEAEKDPNSRFMRDPSLQSASFKVAQERKSILRANLI